MKNTALKENKKEFICEPNWNGLGTQTQVARNNMSTVEMATYDLISLRRKESHKAMY